MKLISANIKCNPKMAQPKVESDVALAKASGTVIGWQEIEIDRYRAAVTTHAEDKHVFEHGAVNSPNPISVRADYYTIVRSGFKLTHHGRALTTPNRYISWAKVRNVRTGSTFIVVNTQFVSGAWNSKPKTFKRWRKRMWLQHYTILKELVLGFHASGYTVLGVGDYNRLDVAKFHPDQVWLANGSIDKVWVLDAAPGPVSLHARELAHDVLHGYTDHGLQRVGLTLHRHG